MALVHAVQLCVYIYALRQAAGCVKAGLGPTASQEDRRGSRWIFLDLTLPMPLHPSGPPFSNLHVSLQRRRGGVCVCVRVVRGMGGAWNSTSIKQEDQQQPERAREQERERETFPCRVCVC